MPVADLEITLLKYSPYGHCKMVSTAYNCLPNDVLCHYSSSKKHSCSMLTAMASLENIWTCKGIKLSLV